MTTFAIATLGCKVNAYESQHYLEQLQSAGYQEVAFKEAADIYVINTCSVTNTAAAKSRQKIHQARRQNPAALIAVIGCYIQAAEPAALAALQADVLIGAQGKSQLVPRIQEAFSRKAQPTSIGNARDLRVFESLHIEQFSHQSRAFLKIQDGCNQFCSYCIIPFARGAERSIDEEQAVSIAKQMAAHGHREIVLSGIHTGRYGKERGSSLLALLKRLVQETPPQVRYRISSIEMNEIDDAFIAFMKEEPRIARHLHIPLQAGDDTVLKRMNRPYTVGWFEQRLADIRRELPGISISTDIIVGFPQESEEQFSASLEKIEKDLRFSFIHCFPYSRRNHTAAADMKGQLSAAVKKERVARLSALSHRLYHDYMETFIGKPVAVVLEQQKQGRPFGHSSEYLPIYLDEEDASQPAVMARVTGFFADGLLAQRMEDAS